MSARIDAATLLGRALLADAARGGVSMGMVTATATRWASATFVGARHHLTIDGAWCESANAWLDALPEADLPLRGHLVADLAVAERSHDGQRFAATLEVLTVEDA